MNKKPIVVILKIGIFVVLLYLTHYPLGVSSGNKVSHVMAKRQAMAKKASWGSYRGE